MRGTRSASFEMLVFVVQVILPVTKNVDRWTQLNFVVTEMKEKKVCELYCAF